MLDYETYCRIRDCHERQHLTIAQTARALGLHRQTVSKWLKADQYRRRQSPPRASRLDPFKAQVVRWLDAHPYSVQQIFQRLREAGFDGGYTIVRDYVSRIAQRRSAREQRLMLRFLSLGPHAQAYYEGLEQRRTNARQHMRKIIALSEIYGVEAVARALEDGLTFHAFSCEYIANILEMKARPLPEPGALHLIRHQDLLDIELAQPDLSRYGPEEPYDES